MREGGREGGGGREEGRGGREGGRERERESEGESCEPCYHQTREITTCTSLGTRVPY